MGVPTAEYDVLEKPADDIEIRYYPEMVIARTNASSSKEAFRKIAAYIFGSNEKQLKISMTTPVITCYPQEEGMEMAFVLPEEFTSTKPPAPLSEDVVLQTLSPRRIAVVKFRGSISDAIISHKRSYLEQFLDSHDYIHKGLFFRLSYDPPWVPDFLKRHEIATRIE
ncbi:SOUL family heme-binding protein [Methanohalophilus mahii]|uniref:SOUL heme-binding protein n=1 Tax=Methanohalophilus mahii (strain ATCC 35705 / DSM 5219 / SLP) TaxID=547558 RepID=D5E9Y4_METMS|nr:heme-binding protein [Methanohalophilus mahii]ADE35985.1 SOUL heme-binding protein [Methanohalophilus mahii DSM 5219]